MLKFKTLFLLSFCFYYTVFAQIPVGYYNSAIGKSGYELKVALSDIIDSHRVVGYNELWYYFTLTDLKPDSTIWDIYTDPTCNYLPDDHGIVGSGECYSFNREHVFCQSWFGYGTDAPYSDMHHIFPVDAWINSVRNNYPYGEVTNPTRIFQNGSRYGQNSFISLTSETPDTRAFEPIQEYKGDIARTLFYMEARYMFEDENFDANQSMTNRSKLRPWAIEMLKNWHIIDPVSQKEIERNDAIYRIQQNRNPFIDHPELVALVWGNDSLNNTFQPEFAPPTGRPYVTNFAIPSNDHIILTFDTTMVSETALNMSNYTISRGIIIDSIYQSSGEKVHLRLATPLIIGLPYYIILRNLQSVTGYFIEDTSIVFVYGYSEYHTPYISWTFDSTSGAPHTPAVIDADINRSFSPAQLFFNGEHGSSQFITGQSGNQLNSYPGTIIGDPRIANAVSGQSLAIVNETANEKAFVFKFSTKFWEDLIITMAVRRTQTGFNHHIWEWSLDGEYFDTLKHAVSVADNVAVFELKTIDLQNIESLNRQDSVYMRITLDGASSNSGNNRFDNITVHAKKCVINYTIYDTIFNNETYYNHGFIIHNTAHIGDFSYSRVGEVDHTCDSLIYLNLHIVTNPNSAIKNNSNITQLPSVTLFPNPANENVYINIDDYDGKVLILLADITGKKLLQLEKNISSISSQIEFPIQNLSSGIYFVNVQTIDGNITKKLIITRR